ncbi:MAG: hypothetical protein IJ418_14475 [Clostridia bacterium]|nr:hypothetical protein [Clostridia bacterium]
MTEHAYRVDVADGALITTLETPLMHQDREADVFRVMARSGMEPLDLTGAQVTACLTRMAPRETLVITGSAQGSEAAVTLTQDCYAVPGPFSLTVQVCLGDVRHTLLQVQGCIARTSMEAIASPDGTLPTIAALKEEVEALRAFAATLGYGSVMLVDFPIPKMETSLTKTITLPGVWQRIMFAPYGGAWPENPMLVPTDVVIGDASYHLKRSYGVIELETPLTDPTITVTVQYPPATLEDSHFPLVIASLEQESPMSIALSRTATDDTLSLEGRPADALKVGTRLAQLQSELTAYVDEQIAALNAAS